MLSRTSRLAPRALRPLATSSSSGALPLLPTATTPSSTLDIISSPSPLLSASRIQPQQQKRSYHEKVLDHYSNPRNVGSLPKSDSSVGTGLVGAPACGDVMKLQIKVNDKSGVIEDVKFKTFGCGSAIASSSYMTELVRGMTLEEAGRVRNADVAKELCLPPVKLHCSMLAEDAIKSAISNYYTKNPKARQTDLGGTGAPMPKVEIERETVSGTAATAAAGAV